MRYYLHKQKSINILILAKSIFFTLGSISPSILALKKATIYQINANYMYEESAELGRLPLAALDQELQPRKPVHFSMSQTLPT